VTAYHARGIRGHGIKVVIIDTGALDTAVPSWGKGVHPMHGLAVSSIITGLQGKFEGIAPEASVIVKDLQTAKNIPISAVLKAIESAVDEGVDILSISLGTTDSWAPMQAVIDKALQKNILVFAAAGNSGDRGYEYPSACMGAISVASINQARQPSAFNTRNDATVLFAPGEKLSLPLGSGELAEFNGTSFATPFAAGLAALVLCAKRTETPGAVIKRREMIDILRDEYHLGLNCTTHTYVMEPTCREIETVASTRPRQSSPYVSIILLLLVLGVGYVVLKV
jgi:subtilisin family serine protease